MASSLAGPAEQPKSIEVFPWLKTLPVAPEFHPTLAEFQDPIAYIFKIEKEASKYGICKIVPPVLPPPKKTAITNLNRSLAARSASSNPKSAPTFTTRQQQIGFCPRKHRPVQKSVWQSGENYTVPQFEAKAKCFERNYLKKAAKKSLTALEVETLYWKATVDKPFSVEYANDMPGSAFVPLSEKKSSREAGDAVTVGETAWNMRGVSRAKGSLLRFMKEEIPGVTSPMVYIAMMFSWFAWHVEDHDLHSLNYLHMGAGKTWYGVPREAAVACEEVIRMQGYGGEINPLVTFATLGEKNTVMSPEVLLNAGVPCCRLVQNAGEFVVTFPRAYHSGFSHGFNCGEAANIATPEWLKVARDAAIRRASINCPPMVSHFQLLYDLALSFCSRVPTSISPEPRSSRLKDKKKGEAETLVKELFSQDLVQNNYLLHVLGKGSSVVLLRKNSFENSMCSNMRVRSQLRVNSKLSHGLCCPDGETNIGKSLMSDGKVTERKQGIQPLPGFYSRRGRVSSLSDSHRFPMVNRSEDLLCALASQSQSMDIERQKTAQCDRLSDQGLFSCVTCGILCFACVAIIQPREAAARYLMSADCSILSNWVGNSGVATEGFTAVCEDTNASELKPCVEWKTKSTHDGLFDVPIQSADQVQTLDGSARVVSNAEVRKDTSSLGLLALTYGDVSDSEEDQVEAEIAVNLNETISEDPSPEYTYDYDNSKLPCHSHSHGVTGRWDLSFQNLDDCSDEHPLKTSYGKHGCRRVDFEGQKDQTFDCAIEFKRGHFMESDTLGDRITHEKKIPSSDSDCSPTSHEADSTICQNAVGSLDAVNLPFTSKSDEDSSRMHVFCLQHAVEVEQQLCPIGGVHMLLLCHPDYPKLEGEAKSVAEELGVDYMWSDIAFRETTKEDEERIQAALNSQEAIHGNRDWAVKLGINLFYSANLSRSPLYSKQMPYNAVIYHAFGRSSPSYSPTKPVPGKGSGKQKRIAVAGKWCGKVWTSNQVHPLLAESYSEEQQRERSFTSWVNSDARTEQQSENAYAAETRLATIKAGIKRKNRVGSRSVRVAKSLKAEDKIIASKGSPVDNSHPQQKRDLRNKQIIEETPRFQANCGRTNRQFGSCIDDEMEGGPSTRLRKRPSKTLEESKAKPVVKKPATSTKKGKSVSSSKATAGNNSTKSPAGNSSTKSPAGNNCTKSSAGNNCTKSLAGPGSSKCRDEEAEYFCDMEGCAMSFGSKQELTLHKRNICPVKGCGKKFFSHKYLVQHRRVHMDDRPLKCPWKGCKMSFKWAWARTEHIRVHTGERPYICTEAGCGQTFRFVSDFSRHKRKTGHSTKKNRG